MLPCQQVPSRSGSIDQSVYHRCWWVQSANRLCSIRLWCVCSIWRSENNIKVAYSSVLFPSPNNLNAACLIFGVSVLGHKLTKRRKTSLEFWRLSLQNWKIPLNIKLISNLKEFWVHTANRMFGRYCTRICCFQQRFARSNVITPRRRWFKSSSEVRMALLHDYRLDNGKCRKLDCSCVGLIVYFG